MGSDKGKLFEVFWGKRRWYNLEEGLDIYVVRMLQKYHSTKGNEYNRKMSKVVLYGVFKFTFL